VILLNDSYWLNQKVDGDVFHQQPKKVEGDVSYVCIPLPVDRPCYLFIFKSSIMLPTSLSNDVEKHQL